MADDVFLFPAEERPPAARAFVPESHRALPMLRLYLPFWDGVSDDPVRWSRHVDVEEQPASVDWFEATRGLAEQHPEIGELTSCMGELDPVTAVVLREAIGDVSLRCLRWVGYGEVPATNSVRVFGDDYFEADLVPGDVAVGRRVPEFAWDEERRLAWGARLYPDSLVIAAELSIFRQLRNDPRVDTASVRPDRDILPRSAGD